MRPFLATLLTVLANLALPTPSAIAQSKPEETIRAYLAAFDEKDDDRRLAKIAAFWSENGVYTDPNTRVEGRQALNKVFSDLRSQFPGAHFETTRSIEAHHDFLRFTWRMIGPDGETAAEGMDIVRLDEDGRIASLTGFLSLLPPDP